MNSFPIGTIRFDELVQILNALSLARRDTGTDEVLSLIAVATGTEKWFRPAGELSQLQMPVMVIEQPKQLTGRQ